MLLNFNANFRRSFINELENRIDTNVILARGQLIEKLTKTALKNWPKHRSCTVFVSAKADSTLFASSVNNVSISPIVCVSKKVTLFSINDLNNIERILFPMLEPMLIHPV